MQPGFFKGLKLSHNCGSCGCDINTSVDRRFFLENKYSIRETWSPHEFCDTLSFHINCSNCKSINHITLRLNIETFATEEERQADILRFKNEIKPKEDILKKLAIKESL